ncbi:MAG: hypothetical protein JSV76_04990 [Candidatus Bathyarchaeota archaeon]|nr:MAG: hypothetical protein JSV76_04990 [Candidatus Bathyarchaeota archaeon]
MLSQGLLFLIVSTLSQSILQILLRMSQQRGGNLLATIATNYCIAAVSFFIATIFSEDWAVSVFTLGFGTLMGLSFLTGMVILTISYSQKGVALTSAIFQLAILIPILLSIFIWRETPSGVQTFGIILAVASLPLLSLKKQASASLDRRVILTTVANFVINGMNMSVGKILIETGYANQQLLFFFTLYVSAAFGAMILVRNKGSMFTRVDVGYGTLIGGLNALLNLTMVAALSLMPGSLAFSFSSSFGLLTTVIFSITLLQERIHVINAIGIITSLVAVVLINL